MIESPIRLTDQKMSSKLRLKGHVDVRLSVMLIEHISKTHYYSINFQTVSRAKKKEMDY